MYILLETSKKQVEKFSSSIDFCSYLSNNIHKNPKCYGFNICNFEDKVLPNEMLEDLKAYYGNFTIGILTIGGKIIIVTKTPCEK